MLFPSLIAVAKQHLPNAILSPSSQFFTADRKKDRWNREQTFEVCPAKSGLFTSSELEMFERYFDTGDATLLPADYSAKKRTGLKIGVLKFVQKEEQYEFQMFTGSDDLPRPAELRDENYPLLNYLHSDYDIENSGNSYESVYGWDYEDIETPPIPSAARRNNLKCSANSIRVFRIDVTGSSSYWDYGQHLRIAKNDTLLSTYYERYLIDDTFGFYDYWPTVNLKEGNIYSFDFLCPGESCRQITEVKLENVYTENENGERVLDVKLRIIGHLAWAHPTYIFFLYK